MGEKAVVVPAGSTGAARSRVGKWCGRTAKC